ncbi:hypothetical protein JZK55_15200 [Dissulfurispira thermophila]|uniref:Uncharacterized protein n=2 Tax=root TaxID=1 RepID=A0A7G1H1U0_9BACT|nr:hypothetical protein [Dissulfurispira thermophila]BCB96598.1 hypothetical protein JZK55_15200 [Dissulfurispira thermophila]
MAKLSNQEKAELLKLASSTSMREDMRYISNHRHNPVMIDGNIDLDRLIEFLTQFNEFMNHKPKPFKPIIDRDMRL